MAWVAPSLWSCCRSCDLSWRGSTLSLHLSLTHMPCFLSPGVPGISIASLASLSSFHATPFSGAHCLTFHIFSNLSASLYDHTTLTFWCLSKPSPYGWSHGLPPVPMWEQGGHRPQQQDPFTAGWVSLVADGPFWERTPGSIFWNERFKFGTWKIYILEPDMLR